MSFRYKKKFPLEPTRKLINDKIQSLAIFINLSFSSVDLINL